MLEASEWWSRSTKCYIQKRTEATFLPLLWDSVLIPCNPTCSLEPHLSTWTVYPAVHSSEPYAPFQLYCWKVYSGFLLCWVSLGRETSSSISRSGKPCSGRITEMILCDAKTMGCKTLKKVIFSENPTAVLHCTLLVQWLPFRWLHHWI